MCVCVCVCVCARARATFDLNADPNHYKYSQDDKAILQSRTHPQDKTLKRFLKVNILANSTWSGLLSYFQGIKIKRFTKW
jgi:hypothetical protein